MKRYALVSLRRDTADTVARYLPGNYKVVGTVNDTDEFPFDGPCAVVQGEDNAGWTLDTYVIPRLASGLITAREIDLSHNAMKQIPYEAVIGGKEGQSNG